MIFRLISTCAVVVWLQGCSLATVDDNLPYGLLNNDDLVLVQEGLPTYLLLVDGFIENWPEDEGLLSSGASLYSAYAGLFATDDLERSKKLTSKALDYGLRSACALKKAYCEMRTISVLELEQLLAKARKSHVPVLYVLGSTWVGYIQQNSSDWNAVAELARVELIMKRVVELDESYEYGQAHMYLGALNSILPASLGGQPDKAQSHFAKSIELSQQQNLMAKVLYAQRYARLIFDQELHDQLLKEVLDAPAEVHGLTLQNTYAKQEAERLLASSQDYFE